MVALAASAVASGPVLEPTVPAVVVTAPAMVVFEDDDGVVGIVAEGTERCVDTTTLFLTLSNYKRRHVVSKHILKHSRQ